VTNTRGRWEIATQRPHETHRMGYGQDLYRATIEHLRKRGDTHADVWREGQDGWRRVSLKQRARNG
jgi:hypothetical protein